MRDPQTPNAAVGAVNKNTSSIKALDLLRDLVRFPTVTPEDAGVLGYLKNVLESLGFVVEVLEFSDPTSYDVKNLLATWGRGSTCLGFCGHLDVVPTGPLEHWKSPPFAAEIVEQHVIGRGTEDMKGGVACFIAALSNFIQNISEDKAKIALLLTLDEEKLAINGVPKLIAYATEKGLSLDACILGEPTGHTRVGDCIKVGRRGSLNFEITLKGRQGHVAYPHLFTNPVRASNQVLELLLGLKLDTPFAGFESTNLEITSINTSSSTHNIVPAEVIIKGNVRFNPSYNLTSLKKIINDCISRVDGAQINFLDDASEAFYVDKNSKVCTALQEAILEVSGIKTNPNTFGGTSDARFLRLYAEVVECGLVEKTLHQVNERVPLADIDELEKIYSKFLKRFFAE